MTDEVIARPHVLFAVTKCASQTTVTARALHDRIGAWVSERRKTLNLHPRYPALLIIDNHSTHKRWGQCLIRVISNLTCEEWEKCRIYCLRENIRLQGTPDGKVVT